LAALNVESSFGMVNHGISLTFIAVWARLAISLMKTVVHIMVEGTSYDGVTHRHGSNVITRCVIVTLMILWAILAGNVTTNLELSGVASQHSSECFVSTGVTGSAGKTLSPAHIRVGSIHTVNSLCQESSQEVWTVFAGLALHAQGGRWMSIVSWWTYNHVPTGIVLALSAWRHQLLEGHSNV
jgi:hypothetical protein